MFTNVDTYSRDKILELNALIKSFDNPPHLIALQEVKPKNYRYERILEEYKLLSMKH